MRSARQSADDIDDDVLQCIADLMDVGGVEDWDEAFRICSTDVARKKKASQVERRTASLEIRAASRGLTGYAAVFGVAATIRDYTETILPGAFRHSLAANKDVVALQDHMSNRPLGRTRFERGQIYSAAADRAQATLVMKEMVALVRADPELSDRIIIREHAKTLEDTQTRIV